MHELQELLTLLGAEHPDADQPVWDITAPGVFQHLFNRDRATVFEEARTELLRLALTELRADHLIIDDSDVMSISGVRAGSEKSEYLLQADIDLPMLNSAALHRGGWSLYASARPIVSVHEFDAFDAAPAELIQILSRLEVTFIIYSYWDDIEWRVAMPS